MTLQVAISEANAAIQPKPGPSAVRGILRDHVEPGALILLETGAPPANPDETECTAPPVAGSDCAAAAVDLTERLSLHSPLPRELRRSTRRIIQKPEVRSAIALSVVNFAVLARGAGWEAAILSGALVACAGVIAALLPWLPRTIAPWRGEWFLSRDGVVVRQRFAMQEAAFDKSSSMLVVSTAAGWPSTVTAINNEQDAKTAVSTTALVILMAAWLDPSPDSLRISYRD